MNYELMKKAYEDFNGVWPYSVPDGMAVRNGEYANVPFDGVFNYREWNWVGTKADFNAYSESLRASNINWDEAPDGATHYGKRREGSNYAWYKLDDGRWFFNLDGYGWLSARSPELRGFENLTPKPKLQPWQPKVGEECEATFGTKKDWYRFVVAGDFGFILIGDYWQRKLVSEYENIDFRPIKTERDKFVEKALSDVLIPCNLDILKQYLSDLYDAGYRKTEEECE